MSLTLEALDSEIQRRKQEKQTEKNRKLLELDEAIRKKKNERQFAQDNPDFVPIPEPVKSKTAEERFRSFLSRRVKPVADPLFGMEGTGATVGATLGITAGPAGVIGTVAAGGLGLLLGQSVENALKNEPFTKGLQKLGEVARRDIPLDMLFMTAGPVVKSVGSGIRNRVLGIGPTPRVPGPEPQNKAISERTVARTSEEVSEGEPPSLMLTRPEARAISAARQNIPVGSSDVADRGIAAIARNTVGRVPIIGGPFIKQARLIGNKVLQRENELLSRLTPWEVTEPQLGAEMVRKASVTTKSLRSTYKRVYTRADELADEAGAKMDMSEIKEIAQEISTGSVMPKTAAGEPIPKVSHDKKFGEFVEKLAEMTDTASPREVRELQKELQSLSKSRNLEGTDLNAAYDLYRSSKRLFMQPSDFIIEAKNAQTLEQAIEEYKRANRLFVNMRLLEKSKAFGKISKVKQLRLTDDPEQVLLTFPGRGQEVQTMTAADLGRTALDARDPSTVRALRELVGDALIRKATKLHITKAFNEGINVSPDGQVVINADKIRNSIGFDSGKKASKEAMNEALRGTGLSANDFEDLISILENNKQPIQPGELLKRRIALGGAQSGAKAAFGGIITAGPEAKGAKGTFGLATQIMTLGIVRHISTLLSRPETLQRWLKMTKDSTSIQKSAFIARQAMGMLFTDEEKEQVGFDDKDFMDRVRNVLREDK